VKVFTERAEMVGPLQSELRVRVHWKWLKGTVEGFKRDSVLVKVRGGKVLTVTPGSVRTHAA
jgi:hypothetical protein